MKKVDVRRLSFADAYAGTDNTLEIWPGVGEPRGNTPNARLKQIIMVVCDMEPVLGAGQSAMWLNSSVTRNNYQRAYACVEAVMNEPIMTAGNRMNSFSAAVDIPLLPDERLEVLAEETNAGSGSGYVTVIVESGEKAVSQVSQKAIPSAAVPACGFFDRFVMRRCPDYG